MTNGWFIVDAHNQFIPSEAVPKSKGTFMDLTRMDPLASPFKLSLDMEKRFQVMDEAGVDMAVTHMASLNLLGLDFCRTMNDGNARLAREYPKRTIALAHIPLDDGASSEGLHEIDRSIQELGLKGVALESSTQKLALSSPELFPMYEKISRLDVPIVVHPANLKMIGSGAGIKFAMTGQVNVEIENTNACVEVMFGVLSKYPDLKFLMPHHGGALPIWQGRMKLRFVPEGFPVPERFKNMPKTPRIREQLGLDKPFQDILDKIYFDLSGFGGWMPITKMAVSIIGPSRLCLGTDYGFEIHEAVDIKLFIDNIKNMDLPEQDKRNILGENIRKLFKLG
ncbi:MAG: amidohydrolase [Dehalococcoidales bacterium]|nr:amidohydrolase [Dehalococcoidales bacterium]